MVGLGERRDLLLKLRKFKVLLLLSLVSLASTSSTESVLFLVEFRSRLRVVGVESKLSAVVPKLLINIGSLSQIVSLEERTCLKSYMGSNVIIRVSGGSSLFCQGYIDLRPKKPITFEP